MQIVAALAEPTPELVETLADGKGLSDALARRVLELDGERVRFTHPLLASSVTGRLGPRIGALHARLSEVTEGEEHARNLALATTRPDADVAATLDGAARLAAARGAPAVAAEFAEHAVRLTPADDTGLVGADASSSQSMRSRPAMWRVRSRSSNMRAWMRAMARRRRPYCFGLRTRTISAGASPRPQPSPTTGCHTQPATVS